MKKLTCRVGIVAFLCLSAAMGLHIYNAHRIRHLVLTSDLNALKAFVKSGGDIEVGTTLYGMSPLMYALIEQRRESFFTLLLLGANPNLSCRAGAAVINRAAAESDPAWLKAAMKAGGDPNLVPIDHLYRGPYGTPLTWAINKGRLDNVKILCDAGAALDATDRFGVSALSEAWDGGMFEIVHYLLERGADYNLPGRLNRTFIDRLRNADPKFWMGHAPEKARWCEKVLEWFAARNLDPAKAVWNGSKWEWPQAKQNM